MNKFLVAVSIVAVFFAGLFFGKTLTKPVPAPAPVADQESAFGAVVHNTQELFPAGIKLGRTSSTLFDSTGNLTSLTYNSASVGSSSSSPAVLGSAVAGHFVIAAAASTANASTTAISANSTIILQQESTTPIAGTTCNTTIASSTVVTSKVVGNGFTVTNSYAPATNPQCMAYFVVN